MYARLDAFLDAYSAETVHSSLQYGGSHLVNTVASYERNPQWRSHSRDMIEAMKRYYANNFVDADKQNAIDLFLGHTEERALEAVEAARRRKARSYRQWYTPSNLEPRLDQAKVVDRLNATAAKDGDYWTELCVAESSHLCRCAEVGA